MAEVTDFNARIVEEFRSNDGKVGGPFEGAPMVVVHHVGRRSGEPRTNPMMYRPADDPDVIYVFASAAGAPKHPDWYHNLVAAGRASIERGHPAGGVDTYDVTVHELAGDERDAVYAAQATDYPGFGEYAEKTAGIRTIPVLALRRA
ncbi:nitroreductase family deazaflavin-dependent oxidoreductase [Nocardioides sp. YIM 152588]|uniref:nitroreductase family deazaflavin-dependent oxidoreductase n=1 Tax=Nocardioides sp. YIM 152588 TaxID=3158259 RepID=UPI0032E3E350